MKLKLSLIAFFLNVSVSIFGQSNDTSLLTKEDDRLFTSVQIEAEFKGGMKAWVKFLEKNLNSEVPKNNGSPAGKYTVEASFTVNKNGKITDINIPIDPGYGSAEEVIRILKLCPKWKPGFQNGVAVKSLKKQRITFMITEK